MKNVKINEIEKKFLTGDMKGIIYKEKTFQPFEIGKIYVECTTGSKYVIVSSKKVDILV